MNATARRYVMAAKDQLRTITHVMRVEIILGYPRVVDNEDYVQVCPEYPATRVGMITRGLIREETAVDGWVLTALGRAVLDFLLFSPETAEANITERYATPACEHCALGHVVPGAVDVTTVLHEKTCPVTTVTKIRS